MRTSYLLLAACTITASALSACLVVPDPEPEIAPEIVVEAPPPPTCYEVSALQRVEIPAETKTVVGISLIENPPYDPIEQKFITRLSIQRLETRKK